MDIVKVVKGGQVEVVEAHQRAVTSGHFTYDDPATGLRVMTRLRHHLKVPPPTFPPPTPPPHHLNPHHHLKGSCCGSACRHCVYSHSNVPAEVAATRRWNGAYWEQGEVGEVEEREEQGEEQVEAGGGPPSLPTTCCLSGCANCVWLDYAEALVSYYQAKGEGLALATLLDMVATHVEDPMVGAFVRMELKAKYKRL